MTNDNRGIQTHNKYTDAYVGILKTYKEQISNSVTKKNELKEKFFNIIKWMLYALTIIFALTMIISLGLFGVMVCKDSESSGIITGAITTLVSSFVTMVLSIFKLPKIIADYLFNKEEDKLMKEIIENIQSYEIEAVKYEIKNTELERVMQLKTGISDATDKNLEDSNYGVPDDHQNSEETEDDVLEESDVS